MAVVVSFFWNLTMTSNVRMKKNAKHTTTAKTLMSFVKNFMSATTKHENLLVEFTNEIFKTRHSTQIFLAVSCL